MKKIIDLVKIKFPLKIKYYDSRPGVILTDRFRLDHNIRTIILGSIVNRVKKINPYVLSDQTNFKKENFFKIFKIKKLNIDTYNSKILHIYIFPKIIFSIFTFYLKSLFKKKKIEWLINDYIFENINIGDLIYDMYVRYDNKFLNPNIYNFRFLYMLFLGMYKLLIIKFYSKKYNIKSVISNQKAYLNFGNLLIRYGIKNNFLTILTGYNFIKVYKNYKETLATPWKINQKLITNTKVSTNKIINFYNKRKVFKIFGNYVPYSSLKKAYGSKKNYKFEKFIKKQKNKFEKINLFALHCFSDAPHLCGGLVFNDYYEQFIETLKFIKNNQDKTLWLVKVHPARKNYGENGLVESKLKEFNIKNVILCPDDINNLQLFASIDNLVTGVSTISLEYACYGKKSLIAGEAPYFHKDLFFKPKNKAGYFNKIVKLNNSFNNNLNKQDIFLAKKILYILENTVNINLSMSKLLPDYNLDKYQSEKNYMNKLIANLKDNQLSEISNDPLYKDILKKINKFKLKI